jgi:hypothetical protein
MSENVIEYKDRGLILTLIGGLLLTIGVACALLGPAEMYCFYLFSEGGRFHYQGFGFGSFMFGNIAFQIVGYYAIALVCIPLGYGHLRRRRWARTLSIAGLWFWLVVGVPLTIVFIFILFSAKELSLVSGAIVLALLGLSYPIIPGLLIWFYRSRPVRLTFETSDPRSYWIEELPMPVLVLGALFVFYAGILHVPILFNGLFPLLGVWLSGLQGILVLDAAIMGLLFLTWGVLRRRLWAWWGSLITFGLLTLSALVTLVGSSFADMLANMNFPPTEMEILGGIPLQGAHFAAFVGLPLLLTLGLIALSKRYYGDGADRQAMALTGAPGTGPT